MSDNDPFLSKPDEQGPTEPPRYHPASGMNPGQSHAPVPGMIPGAAAPPPSYPMGSQIPPSPVAAGLDKPSGLGTALIVVTGLSAVIGLAVAATAQETLDGIREFLETEDPTAITGSPLANLSFPLLLATYVLYGIWMNRMRRNRQALGTRPGLPGVEWWGWFIPLANAVLVPLGARKVAGRTSSLAMLLGWWLTYLAAGAVSGLGAFALVMSIDIETMTITDNAAFDSYAQSAWVAAILTVVSWAFLFGFVRSATERHLDPQG
ncbi:hypothetical protein [Demequina mangrovi]|uniref:DUF4328 domain-containing protein n=1 Tax=Demequina mangrovi TaxID=1043493 RepID=A0A1H6X5R8_9MICO|nr:hypothetical protein [Demequina mangrovi]SEJ19915.1 hypothetical protein SAMN05421637_1124 [Demequina mangrovi]